MRYLMIIGLSFIMAACGSSDAKEGSENSADSTGVTKQLPIVTAQALTIDTFEHYFAVQGEVQTNEIALVQPEASGTYLTVNAQVGDVVNTGQVIAQVNTDILRSNLQELKKNLEMASFVYEKQKNLWDQKVGSELQYLEAKTRKESLEQSVKTLETQISKATVTAPFSGVIDEVFVKKGEMANPMAPTARLVNLNNLYVEVEVPENYLGKVKVGSPVKIEIKALDYMQEGKIARVGRYIQSSNRTFKVQIDLDNRSQDLVPNLIATVRIQDMAKDSAVMIPSSNIVQDSEGNNYVFVLKQSGKAKQAIKTQIETGLSYEGKTLVLSGLTGNESIVADGARSINDKDMVEVK